MSTSRRKLLRSAAILSAGAATGATVVTPGAAQSADALFVHPLVTIPIESSEERFAVRRIYCIGRNYAAHARERGSDPDREPPFFFQKPRDAVQIVPFGTIADHPYPTKTKNYHHEIELVV